ncbi:MAG: PorT family protein [Bacteroidaceae bacterium]|nr:PorT family protein [Bacteroidaceae bacterium]
MIRRAVIILSLCIYCAFTFAQQGRDALINYGVKGGFSSTIYEVHDLTVAGQPINNYMAKSEISSFYTAFARVNIKRHYLQTEVSYNISNYSIDFSSDQWNTSAQPQNQSTISTKIIGLEVPLYYGYHILKEGPYGLSLYIGPKAKFILTDYSSHTFNNFPYTHIEEHIHPINFSLMIGLGINISRVFFDFSFEYGLHNISNGFTTIDIEENTSPDNLIFNRRKNVFSFSIGFMF